jgi:alpha-ketoglutarate-dependent taurine dioxygenase
MDTTKAGEAQALPLEFRPEGEKRSARALADRVAADRASLSALLLRHGALRFRGWDVATPEDFERVALALEPDLAGGEYLGTSPRDALTRHVYSASELPGYYPIPQHCEMTFLRNPPRRIFFACLWPSRTGGETPLADFRRVWADLDPGVRDRLVSRGIRIVRNYAGPESPRSFDLTELKRYDAMFGTTDRRAIESKCAAEGMEVEWLPEGRLRIACTPPAMRPHPETGEPVYFSHLQVFHVSTAEAELRRVRDLRGDVPSKALHWLGRAVTAITERRKGPLDRAMHVLHADGGEIARSDVEHVRDVIWRHMRIEPWQRGDVVAIDNRAISHGRLPYRGARTVVVAWA